jgi:hypothetical protein
MSDLLSGCLSCRLLSNERLPQFDELLLGVIERLPSICLKPIKRPTFCLATANSICSVVAS